MFALTEQQIKELDSSINVLAEALADDFCDVINNIEHDDEEQVVLMHNYLHENLAKKLLETK